MNLKKLIDVSKRIVQRKDVKYVIGYGKGSHGFRMTPVFIEDKKEIDRLTFSPLCNLSLVNYLKLCDEPLDDPEGKKTTIGIMVRGCDSRALSQMIAEKGIARDKLYIIGIPCTGVIDLKKIEERFPGVTTPAEVDEEGDDYIITLGEEQVRVPKAELMADTCKVCRHPTPVLCDKLIGDAVEGRDADYEDVVALQDKTREEKWDFWRNQFSRCVRCYACKNACPLCYCDTCVLENFDPQWIRRSVDAEENFLFHITRAFHLAGRCVSCGECERACPMGIPLMKLNRKMEKDVQELFDFEAGMDPESKALLTNFKANDPDDFIL